MFNLDNVTSKNDNKIYRFFDNRAQWEWKSKYIIKVTAR